MVVVEKGGNEKGEVEIGLKSLKKKLVVKEGLRIM